MDNTFVTLLAAGDTIGTGAHQTRISADSGLTIRRLKGTTNRSPVFCPECKMQVHRQQELRRHILSMHLPRCIFCPYPSCTWRGTRTQELKRHLDKSKCGPRPEQEEYQIYDANLILGWILEGDTPIRVAASYALDFVGERAKELGKVETWSDLWGH